MKQKIHTWLWVGVFWLLPALSFAQDSGAGQIFLMDLGARATGMGGAQVAVADDLAAARYNPAGLASLLTRSFSIMRSSMSLDRTQTVIQGALPLRLFGNSVIGVNYLKFGIDNIQCFDSNGNPCANPIFDDSEQLVWVTYARNILPRLSAGVNLKFFSQSICTASASGIGSDFGFLYKIPTQVAPLDRIQVGLLIQDPERMVVQFRGHSCAPELVTNPADFIDPDKDGIGFRIVRGRDTVPTNYRFGTAFYLFHGAGIFAVDWDKRSDFHLGGEYWIKRVVGLRLGFNGTSSKLTAGGSVRFGSATQQYQLDFSFQQDNITGNNTQATLTARF